MKYISVCSGIEAASVAWHPLGWSPVAFSEIERFPSAVLKHHYPTVPNWGDMTRYAEWPDADVDVLVGGTPCQSFSVAGLRKGLDDPRGNLMLTYGAIAKRYRPRWLVWENVPGVLSSDGGRDFGTFLGMLAELGYGFAYRVLDAQYVRVDGHPRAVPQRRRRVFVVGHLGDWRRAAAVLFERESLSGHPAPRREAGQTAPTIPSRSTAGGGLGTDFDCDGGLIQGVAEALLATDHKGPGHNRDHNMVASCVPTAHRHDPTVETLLVSIQERAVCENPDAGPDGSGVRTDGTAYTLEARSQVQAVVYRPTSPTGHQGDTFVHPDDAAICLAAGGGNNGGGGQILGHAVRRLTPRECERLQGFPDDYTDIPWRGKTHAPDGPRYKALGNSMACNVMRWVGQRIQAVEEVASTEEAAA